MTAAVITAALFFCNITPFKNAAKDSLPCPDNTNKFILFWVKSNYTQILGIDYFVEVRLPRYLTIPNIFIDLVGIYNFVKIRI